MSLPGASYKPAAGDATKNGVYQDFAAYIRNYPTRWSSVRASRTNNLDMGIYKNFVIRERLKTQFRFETYNTFNHARFAALTPPAPVSEWWEPRSRTPRAPQMALKVSF